MNQASQSAAGSLRVGDIEILPVSDGTAQLPPAYFPNATWDAHQDLIGPDGTIPIALGCFVVRTGDRTILVDAGIGPFDNPVFVGGRLPGALEAAGVDRGDIDTVVCTHLHLDHVGWLVREEQPFFPNATVRFGAADYEHFVSGGHDAEPARHHFEVLEPLGRLESIDRDGDTIAPGVTARFTPGHTPGSLSLVVASGSQRALLLGDAVTCPVQLEEPDWQAISDVDADLAARTREALWRELEGTDDLVVAAHFPDLRFGRVLGGEGKRWFQV